MPGFPVHHQLPEFTETHIHWAEKATATHSSTLAWKIPWTEEPGRLQPWGHEESDMKSSEIKERFHFHFHFQSLEKEMATHSSFIAWGIPGMAETDGLPSMGLHRVEHDWSDLAAATAWPLSHWCHPTISSSDVPFSSHLQSFPASGLFQTSQLFASGGQSIGVSASTSVLPMII